MSGGRSSLLLFFVAFISSASALTAAEWQATPFVNSLKGSLYEFDFLVQGLKSVHSIDFKKAAIPQYQSFFNRLVLDGDIDDGSHRIKPMENLEPQDFGTVAHESFHAFKANFIDVDPKFKSMKLWMELRAKIVYPELDQKKAETALEEAYAVFIESVISRRISILKLVLQKKSGDCVNEATAKKLWDSNWDSDVIGYYYRDGIGEYWADHFQSLLDHLTNSHPEPKAGADGAIYADAPIADLDKDWIGQHLLQGRIESSFADTFKDQNQVHFCSVQP